MKRIKAFFESPTSGGICLILASLVGIIWANTSAGDLYFHLLHTYIGPLKVELWINDVFMAIFFLSVGLELKREMVIGQLNTNAKRFFPGLAATCGFLLPAGIYAACSHFLGAPMDGWAIPTATDIAFALGVCTLLQSRVPMSLKIFLTALAVIDDLMAIIVIAIFYSAQISWVHLAGAVVVIATLMVLNKRNVYKKWPYMILGVILWLLVFQSGLHATLAGVILALTIPYTAETKDGTRYPLVEWVAMLEEAVTFLIIPIFGFANAGVSFGSFHLGDLLNPVVLGIAGGLFIGKQVGVFSLMYVLIKTKVVPMPAQANWRHMYGIALLCGIGFTMSLFVSMLAFSDPHHLDYAKIGVFLGSILSAALGAIVLRMGPEVPLQEGYEAFDFEV